MTLGIFLPAFVFPIFFHRGLVAIAENPRIRPFLLGVAAAVIGLIAAVTVDIVDASVVDVPTAILAAAAFPALNRWHGKLTVRGRRARLRARSERRCSSAARSEGQR